MTEPLPYETIAENVYLHPEDRSPGESAMPCQCTEACDGPECLNRATYMECDPETCPCRERCRNQALQRRAYAAVELFETAEKGFGLRALADISPGALVVEYVGEVIRTDEFASRARAYSAAGMSHYFTMNAGPDLLIDATQRGNVARFVNHSCAPNAETQKWLVRGETRIGIFASRGIRAGEEITFDYKFVRFGQTAQRCLCREPNCKGFIGIVRSASGAIQRSGIAESLQTGEDVRTCLATLAEPATGEGVRAELLAAIANTSDDVLLRELIFRGGIPTLAQLPRDENLVRALQRLPITSRHTVQPLMQHAPPELRSKWQALPDGPATVAPPAASPWGAIVEGEFFVEAPNEASAPTRISLNADGPALLQSQPVQPAGEWREAVSDAGVPYYYHTATGERRWEPPAKFVALPRRQANATRGVEEVLQRARDRASSAATSTGGAIAECRTEEQLRDAVRSLVLASPHAPRDDALRGKLLHTICEKEWQAARGGVVVLDAAKEARMRAFIDDYLRSKAQQQR